MKLLEYLILPRQITEFERAHLQRMNRIGLGFLALHVPVFALIAFFHGTGTLLALGLTLAVLAGPALAYATLENPRAVSLVYGIASMFMGGVLVHIGQGPVQIEMHFYFFAVIAMLALYGNPTVILVAAATVALHHLALWLVLPRSVFNYDAPVWVVAVHALFVVIESVGACFMARSFFDNVISLERIVATRTIELDARNRDMRLLLDSVDQGFVMLDIDMKLSSERSATFDQWFGTPEPGASLSRHLSGLAPDFAEQTEVAWGEVAEGIMPLSLTLHQMPSKLEVAGCHYRFAYTAVGGSGPSARYLLVITDVSSEVERNRSDLDRRELTQLFERVATDRSGVQDFIEEAGLLIEHVAACGEPDRVAVGRALHTLKGNCAIFGLEGVAALCHDLETSLVEEGTLRESEVARLTDRWRKLGADVDRLLGLRARVIEIDLEQHAALERAVRNQSGPTALLRMLRDLKLEPSNRRLAHFADQAKRIARRLDKGDVEVMVEDHGVRMDGKHWSRLWSAMVHGIRNAVDHGIESGPERVANGKPERGKLVLRTRIEHGALAVEIQDDGQGIDWDRIAAKAAALGCGPNTPDDRRSIVFQDGVTTATEVTSLSGRGIGMGALRAATEALGGYVDIVTERGRGTTVRMIFPQPVAVAA